MAELSTVLALRGRVCVMSEEPPLLPAQPTILIILRILILLLFSDLLPLSLLPHRVSHLLGASRCLLLTLLIREHLLSILLLFRLRPAVSPAVPRHLNLLSQVQLASIISELVVLRQERRCLNQLTFLVLVI